DDAWARRIGELGIDKEARVVVYDDNASKDAARIWWILRFWGMRDVRLLNGGWGAWKATNGPLATDDVKPPFRKLSLSAQAERLATKEQVLDALKHPGTQIVDARSRAEYCGEEMTAKRNGAIPGARHLEWRAVIDDATQRFKRAEALAELSRRH